ncbi:hypothetical protein SERLADRAFT_360310 [Serpula lacrymans var. lacrymans S7.9]|uniref:Zn-dependent exopeptidase n=1 Tax=Serpula lacrymans var. lacrymans (strain S7.9) TaxID=578457 RepID=F8NPA3_SERL9|nr:uncharacterized protein SERLADRAFT_360310 [Serpula lacrymans var. lacrymans S7.9]EGO27668.1 hypothetical protein SERLADRAFT_360310 [Serpula lacrymans var. lacrymans S7.9]
MGKQSLTKETSSSDSIPVPVVTQRPSSSSLRVQPWIRWLLLISIGSRILWDISKPRVWHTGGDNGDQWVDALTSHHSQGKKQALFGKRAEKLFLSIPNESSALAASRKYASKPHMAGTAGDLDTAKYFLSLLENELGIDSSHADVPIFPAGSEESRNSTLSIPYLEEPKAWIDVYYPALNSPLEHSLEILGEDGSPVWSAQLEEVSDETDPDAHKHAQTIPTWHGISRGGEAQGKLIYAHFGRKQDYDALVEAGVDFNGSIVLVRYGGNFRGLKVKAAQELGAAAVLIYSDLRDDGTVTVENGYVPYPHGPARNPTSVQRGSVQFLSIYAGDPTTPGYPSYENSTRTEGWSKPTIPSLPISWENAKVLLEEIEKGDEARAVRVVNHVDEKITPIWNTMGVIPGHIKDEVVILGNHRDGRVLGATDPTSGTVSVHETIRGFGALLRKGWKPLRTIVFASWDGEEYGLIGSTEWGEDFADWINKHVVAYVNIDSSTSGSHLGASASPLLAHLLRQTAEEIPHPTSEGRTLWDARHDTGTLFGENLDPEVASMHQEELLAIDSIGVNALGSGSDYTVFLQYIGVPSTNGGFSSTLHDPVYHYHSVFDSQRWQEMYGDPGFYRHVAIAKHIGLQVLRLSGSIVLPFNTTHYSYELESYLDSVEAIASDASFDVDLSPLRNSIHHLQSVSFKLDTEKEGAERNLKKVLKKLKKQYARHRRFRRKLHEIICKVKTIFHKGEQCDSDGFHQREEHEDSRGEEVVNNRHHHLGHRPPRALVKAIKRVQAVNKKLITFERGFISKEGIKDREWYKHLAVAPGKWLGYGATTFPGLTEALTFDRNTTTAVHEANRLKVVIDNIAETIRA